MKKSHVLLTVAVVTMLVGGPAVAQAQTVASVGATAQAVSAPGDLTEAQSREASAKLRALLPLDYEARLAAVEDRAGIDVPMRDLLNQVINPEDYKCDTTALRTWQRQTTANWTVFDAADASIGALLVLADVLFFPDSTAQHFGADGEFTIPVTHSFQDLKSFWDIPSQGIELRAMHGSTLLDRARVARTVKLVFGLDDQTAAAFADLVALVFGQDKFDHGNHPLLTFNAFAFGGADIPGVGTIPRKIVMGDGILAGFDALGMGDVAARAILAHEYGHHAQFANNQNQSELTGPEASRRLELMADAYAAYHLTHARGAAMNRKRVQQFEETFYNVGDCNFTFSAHHGTPTQRTRAAEWGHDLAADVQKQGQILSSVTFGRLFDQALPTLVAPDAG